MPLLPLLLRESGRDSRSPRARASQPDLFEGHHQAGLVGHVAAADVDEAGGPPARRGAARPEGLRPAPRGSYLRVLVLDSRSYFAYFRKHLCTFDTQTPDGAQCLG